MSMNTRTAVLLREYGLDAEAEQRIPDTTASRRQFHQMDIAVGVGDESVAIEAEFDPARTVLDEAESRLPPLLQGPLYWRGLEVTRAVAVVYPHGFNLLRESEASRRLGSATGLRFRVIERDVAGVLVHGIEHTGTVRDLGDLLLSFWTQQRAADNVERIVGEASAAIDLARGILADDPYLNRPHDDSDPAATCALIWLNALLFQHLLAADLDPSSIPPPNAGESIPVPRLEAPRRDVLADWEFILGINWYPIFHLARRSLEQVSAHRGQQALNIVGGCAATMAASKAVRRHDISGRIFHRLLGSRKFLATNYTTVPAAVMLAGLAFGSDSGPLAGKDLTDEAALADSLRVVDPACGSGTLLMAALQEIVKACRHAKATAGDSPLVDVKPGLEKSIYGMDVVPGAQHLTNTTLSMAETTRVLEGLPVYVMPHDCDEYGVPRLGSLDFLNRAPNRDRTRAMELFPPAGAASRQTGAGSDRIDVHLPTTVDLFISTPPYTRAGGPGTAEHTAWNPLFGSVLAAGEADRMKKATQKALVGTVGSLYAGLGSAFVALIDQELEGGGMAALVLPLTAVTGSRWQKVREKLLSDYRIEWVVVSHDPRHRGKRAGLPGRLWVSFSESTRIAEVLVIATRQARVGSEHRVRFVNLRHNPDDPSEAMALTRSLLGRRTANPISGDTPMLRSAVAPNADVDYGEVVSVPQRTLTAAPWPHVVFTRSVLTEAAILLQNGESGFSTPTPITPLGDIAELGPYEMQIKNPKQGLFDIATSPTPPPPLEIPALWHHKSKQMTTMLTAGNAVLTRRPNLKPAQDTMLYRQGTLHLARELRHAPQRLAAACTTVPMLGVRSWITVLPNIRRDGFEQVLCLWFNSTLGMLLRLLHANRPYLGRSALPHELARTLPTLDVSDLTDRQLQSGSALFDDFSDRTFLGFSHIRSDPARVELNKRFMREVLEGSDSDVARLTELTDALSQEPTLHVRH